MLILDQVWVQFCRPDLINMESKPDVINVCVTYVCWDCLLDSLFSGSDSRTSTFGSYRIVFKIICGIKPDNYFIFMHVLLRMIWLLCSWLCPVIHCWFRNRFDDWSSWILCNRSLKEPGPITSDFSQTFIDFGVRRKVVFFSLPLVNFTVGKCTVWKILIMKMWLESI